MLKIKHPYCLRKYTLEPSLPIYEHTKNDKRQKISINLIKSIAYESFTPRDLDKLNQV